MWDVQRPFGRFNVSIDLFFARPGADFFPRVRVQAHTHVHARTHLRDDGGKIGRTGEKGEKEREKEESFRHEKRTLFGGP